MKKRHIRRRAQIPLAHFPSKGTYCDKSFIWDSCLNCLASLLGTFWWLEHTVSDQVLLSKPIFVGDNTPRNFSWDSGNDTILIKYLKNSALLACNQKVTFPIPWPLLVLQFLCYLFYSLGQKWYSLKSWFPLANTKHEVSRTQKCIWESSTGKFHARTRTGGIQWGTRRCMQMTPPFKLAVKSVIFSHVFTFCYKNRTHPFSQIKASSGKSSVHC